MKDNHDRLKKAKRTVALSSIGGTVFDAHLKEVDGQVVWKVKLLTSEGRVKMYIDGHSGRVLAAKAEIVVDESYGRISLDAAVTRPVPILKPLPRYGASAS